MNELAEDYKAMKQRAQQRHADNYTKNLEILFESRIPFELKVTVALFREWKKPKVDFYPHTGRWKVQNKVYSGGADSFLAWYKKQ